MITAKDNSFTTHKSLCPRSPHLAQFLGPKKSVIRKSCAGWTALIYSLIQIPSLTHL